MAIQNSKLTLSSELGDVWQDEMVISKADETLQWLFIFAEAMPRTVDLKVRLTGVRSRAEIVVAYLGSGIKETEMNIALIHDAPESYGRITAKAALFDQSRFVFRGMLDVQPEAKGSDTYLLARGLMVSPEARAEIYPYLEIATDEIRASHGSTVGHLDRNHLFYLQSRGISREDAEKIILAGFFRDVAKEIPLQWRERFFQFPVFG